MLLALARRSGNKPFPIRFGVMWAKFEPVATAPGSEFVVPL
jgi:hypothetical protein